MIRRLAAAALVVALAAPAAHADFSAIARAIDAQRGVSRIWIPFLGVARVAVWLVQPEGVRDFQLVTFRGADKVDAAALQAIMHANAGQGFVPLVQARSRRTGEWSFIYARPMKDGKHVELMVLAHDDENTVLVRVEADTSVIAHEMERRPRNITHVAVR